jgi:hypothetical protein
MAGRDIKLPPPAKLSTTALAEGDLSRRFFLEFVEQPEGLVALRLGFWRIGRGVSCGRFHSYPETAFNSKTEETGCLRPIRPFLQICLFGNKQLCAWYAITYIYLFCRNRMSV